MTILRSNVDPNALPVTAPTSFIPERVENEVRCGMCARTINVDDETYHFGIEAIDSGLDNPFRCEVCAEEYDDLSYEG